MTWLAAAAAVTAAAPTDSRPGVHLFQRGVLTGWQRAEGEENDTTA
jgi:hypothetical protein